jgi:hypothetical protein
MRFRGKSEGVFVWGVLVFCLGSWGVCEFGFGWLLCVVLVWFSLDVFGLCFVCFGGGCVCLVV